MAEKLDPDEMVNVDELLIAYIYEQDAIRNVLEAKGILTKQEVLEEVKRLKFEGLQFGKTH